jgi:hypothetical protein
MTFGDAERAMADLHMILARMRRDLFWSDDESSVEMISRYQLRYREGVRSLLVYQELQADPHVVAIERAPMKAWEPPHEGDPLDDGDRDRIIENMRRAFSTRNYILELLDE